MDTQKTRFQQGLDLAAKRLEKARKTLELTQKLAEFKRIESAYSMAFDAVNDIERLALLMRVLPAYTGNPQALKMSEKMIADIVPTKIGFTREGWFAVFVPALLPKKCKGNADYIEGILYPVMRRFFQDNTRIIFPKSVLIYRHVYLHDRPERKYRDHDNIEINTVTNIIALYVMRDDSPKYCNHYYCSAAGNEDRTEVYVVPLSEFTDWLVAEKSFPDEGIKLLENRL